MTGPPHRGQFIETPSAVQRTVSEVIKNENESNLDFRVFSLTDLPADLVLARTNPY